jgi:GT2 family glycosyltransferase
MVSVVYCTRESNPKHYNHLQSTCGVKGVEIIEYVNKGESLTKVYNKFLKETKYDIVVFCHDDIVIGTQNWGRKVIKHFDKNTEYGIIGKAGTKYIPKSGLWWDKGMCEAVGQVYHEQNGKKWLSKYSEPVGNKLIETIIVDGLFFAVHKNRLQETFDENVKGFHFYDVDFCFSNFNKGVKVGVISNISVTHLSVGQTNSEWEKNRIQFSKKNKSLLPVITDYEYNNKPRKVKNQPLVSIVMPIYNYGDRLNHSLKSVFNQDYTNYEIIIVDDGSIDEYLTLKLPELDKLENVRVIRKENGGPSSARNLGIKESNGEFILPLDADDMILNGYIKTCVSILSKDKDISPVYCDTIHAGQTNGIEKRPNWSKEQLIKGPFIVNCSMFTKKAFDDCGGYDEDLIGWEDYDLWLRMMKNGYTGKRIPKPLFVYFHHENDGTVSTKANQNQQELYQNIMYKNFDIENGKILI